MNRPRPHPRPARLVGAVLGIALVLPACSLADDGDPDAGQAADQEAGDGGSPEGGGGQETAEDSNPEDEQDSEPEDEQDGDDAADEAGEAVARTATLAGIDPEDPPEPQATITVETGLDEDVESLEVAFYGLERREEMMVARWGITPTLERSASSVRYLRHLMDSSWSPYILDEGDLLKYGPLRSSGGRSLRSSDEVGVADGQESYIWAAFPLPDEDAGPLQVYFSDAIEAVVEVDSP